MAKRQQTKGVCIKCGKPQGTEAQRDNVRACEACYQEGIDHFLVLLATVPVVLAETTKRLGVTQ